MSCRNVSRELLDRIRFGELDADCDRYLAHVERCADCQHEIAIDRAVATALRRALRERVQDFEPFEPSPAVWRAVRLQAADPEPPRGWWSDRLVSLTRAMRVMVPATAFLLAAVLSWSGPEVAAPSAAPADPAVVSQLQWREQLATTATVEALKPRLEIALSPSIAVPRPSGEMQFPEPVARIKQFSTPPSTGGLIR